LTTKTAIAYARALDAKDRGDIKAARAELRKLVQKQPDFKQAKRLLASLKR
jgi:predicted Zn-dependent protease